jgi:uncharacterized protein
MTQVSHDFQVFVKPVGAECNLRCSYCYYLKNKSLYPDNKQLVMQDYLLEKYVIQHISATTGNSIFFSWHGGEPLLAGIEFFRKALSYQKKHRPPGKVIINGIQTNGILLDDDWCKFLSGEEFVVGLSIDGPGDLHNKNRRTPKNQPTLEKVIRGCQLLKSYGIIPEILCVVNSMNVKYPLVVYDFLKDLGIHYITFLPLVERSANSSHILTRISVPSHEYGVFLSTIFDEWVEKDIGKIKIQIIEEAARTAFNQEHTLCIFKMNCGGVPVVEHNGDFYSCDHYVDNDHKPGNINQTSLSHLLESPAQIRFGKEKSLTLPKYCIECEVRSMCNGECPKNRFIKSPDGEPGLNYLCDGYKYFFNHCRPFVEAIGTVWRKNQK